MIVIIAKRVFPKWFVKKCRIICQIWIVWCWHYYLSFYTRYFFQGTGVGVYQAIGDILLSFRGIPFKLSNLREREREFKIVSPVNRDSNRVQDRILKEPWGAQHNMFFTGSCLQCLLYTFPYTLCGRLFSIHYFFYSVFH